MFATEPRPRPRARKRRSCWATLLVAGGVAAGTSCASTSAPRGFLPDPEAAQTDAFGSWIDVIIAPPRARIAGELIAIDDETTWVLTGTSIRSFATPSIVEGQLVAYDSRAGVVGGAAVLGFLSTISNGAFLILTAPMWLIGGSVAAGHQSRVPIEEMTPESPTSFARFARFPMGMPEGLDPQTLEGAPSLRR